MPREARFQIQAKTRYDQHSHDQGRAHCLARHLIQGHYAGVDECSPGHALCHHPANRTCFFPRFTLEKAPFPEHPVISQANSTWGKLCEEKQLGHVGTVTLPTLDGH